MKTQHEKSVHIIGNRLVLFCILSLASASSVGKTDDRWWPTQIMPKAVIRTSNQEQFPEPRLSHQMMVQSVAGLAAKAVNEGHGDEMVWVDNGNINNELLNMEDWYSRLTTQYPNVKRPGVFDPWALVDRYVSKGLIKGYILYRSDPSIGETNVHRPGMDCSVNVATSLAGILNGIIVDETLENKAISHGLTLLMDVRDKTQQWCFETYKDQFNRQIACTQDPKKFYIRDLAIAQKAFTVYGDSEPTPAVMKWLKPLSPILGWNGGDEFITTNLSSKYGHIQTATDWCMNLPILMAKTENANIPEIKSFNPNKIDWNDSRSGVSFVSSDGDNVQWYEANFFRSNKSYWGNPKRGQIPFGWSCCFDQLMQLCPQAINYAIETQSPNDGFIEWGGGYYFPDSFGLERKNRRQLLARHAKRTWNLMKKTNTRIIGFNTIDCDSKDALEAYQVFAEQTDGLLAILIFQYAPYNGGYGQVFWVKDSNGIEIPVVTARYAIWNNANSHPYMGTPAKVAREIQDTVKNAPQNQLPRYDWVISHVWSYFQLAPGTDENAENMPQADAAANGGVRGYTPVTWCTERLPSDIRIVSPEEMIWRIRMKHNPSQTLNLIKQFK